MSDDQEWGSLFDQFPRFHMSSKRAEEMAAILRKREQEEYSKRRYWSLLRRGGTILAVAGAAAIMLYLPVPEHPGIPGVNHHEQPLINAGKIVGQTLEKVYSVYPELRIYHSIQHLDGDRVQVRLQHAKDAAQAELTIDTNTGKLISFQWFLDASLDNKEIKASDSQAKSFLQAMLGGQSHSYRLSPGSQADSYQFVRYVNEIPVIGDEISIETNETGRVINYWDHTPKLMVADHLFPPPANLVSIEQIRDKLAEEMRLVYVENARVGEGEGNVASSSTLKMADAALIYTPGVRFPGSVMFNAESGDLIYMSNYDRDFAHHTQPQAVKPPERLVTVKSNEEVIELLHEFGYSVKAPEKISRQPLKAKQAWTYMVDGEPRVYADQLTGAVLFIRGDTTVKAERSSQLSPKKLAIGEAEREAIRLIEPYLDPGVSELQLAHRDYIPEWGAYKYYFLASYRGIPMVQRHDGSLSYQVTIDAATGQMKEFSRLQVPALLLSRMPEHLREPNVISQSEAAKLFIKETALRLGYIYAAGNQNRPTLVYLPENSDPVRIDAITGRVLTN